MGTITNKKLYDLITTGKLEVTVTTSRYDAIPESVDIIEKDKFMEELEAVTHAGRLDIIDWTCYVNIDGTVVAKADLHDQNAGAYIELLGKISGGLSVKDFEAELNM